MNRPSRARGMTRIAAALATSAIAIGLLALPGTAHAAPLHPQNAPKCNKFALSNEGITKFVLTQDNGPEVWISVNHHNGTEVSQRESFHTSPGKTAHTYGTATGGINGRTINFSVNWSKGPGVGNTGVYTGQVNDQGFSFGTARSHRGQTANWRGKFVHGCLDEPPPPPAPKQIGGKTATVTSDVDLYDVPGGNGKVLRILRKGEVVKVVKPCPAKDWCELAGGVGWAWGEFLKNN